MMFRMWKTYWAFTNWKYRFVVFVVVPVLLFGLNGLSIISNGEVPIILMMMLSFSLLVCVEVLSDHWYMGGMYGKGNSSLECLQTSPKFREIIRNVVVADLIRRFITYILFYLMVMAIGVILEVPMEEFQMFVFLPLYGFVISQVANLIVRHFNNWQYVYSASMFALLIASWGLVYMMEFTMKHMLLCLGILVALAVLTIVITIWYSLKKVKDSYYDK